MNVVKQIRIDNSDSEMIEKLEELEGDYIGELNENELGGSRCYNARRRFYRFLNKLSGGLGGETYMITSNGWNSNGDRNLVIGN